MSNSLTEDEITLLCGLVSATDIQRQALDGFIRVEHSDRKGNIKHHIRGSCQMNRDDHRRVQKAVKGLKDRDMIIDFAMSDFSIVRDGQFVGTNESDNIHLALVMNSDQYEFASGLYRMESL